MYVQQDQLGRLGRFHKKIGRAIKKAGSQYGRVVGTVLTGTTNRAKQRQRLKIAAGAAAAYFGGAAAMPLIQKFGPQIASQILKQRTRPSAGGSDQVIPRGGYDYAQQQPEYAQPEPQYSALPYVPPKYYGQLEPAYVPPPPPAPTYTPPARVDTPAPKPAAPADNADAAKKYLPYVLGGVALLSLLKG